MYYKNIKSAELMVKALENEGVEYVFGVPGEENLDFLEALRTSSITFILTRHEQAAAFMAATYGRLTGKAGVCLSTLGPGATNLVTGVAYAKLGAMPMVVITGQKPIKKSKQGRFQIIDAVNMMRPISKWALQIVEGSAIPSLIREAFHFAESERPGPVHLELPEDIAAEVIAEAYLIEKPEIYLPKADERMIDQAVEVIANAKRPLLLVGAGANRKWVCDSVRSFIEDAKIPFFNTQMGKGVVTGHHALFMGTAALSENDFLHCIIDAADVIINAGHDVIEKPPFFMHSEDKRKVVHVNFLHARTDMVYFPQLEVIGDIGDSLQRIGAKLKKKNVPRDFSNFIKMRKGVEKQIHQSDSDDRFPIIPQRLVRDVREVMPDDGIIALDNGMYKIWFARNYVTLMPNTVLLDNALATMGAGLPSAMMAAMLYPERNVMAICGDGGFMMNSQELETAVRLKLNLVVTILRDDAYGMIRWKQAVDHFEDFGMRFSNPDFVKYAESYGAKGHRVSKSGEFVALAKHCFKQGGVHVIEVPIDYSENMKVLGNIQDAASKCELL